RSPTAEIVRVPVPARPALPGVCVAALAAPPATLPGRLPKRPTRVSRPFPMTFTASLARRVESERQAGPEENRKLYFSRRPIPPRPDGLPAVFRTIPRAG